MKWSDFVTGQPWNHVAYGTSQRYMGGASQAPYDDFNLGLHVGDCPEHVEANRQQLRALLPSEPIWLNQVHGTTVLNADQPLQALPTADAIFTTQKNKVLAIMTADCLPVLVCGDHGKVVGAAHAGWRGLQAGILENLIQTMPATHFSAWIGPAISFPVFEVGQEVYEAFTHENPNLACFFQAKADGKWLADLAEIARYRLERCGVSDVIQSHECTFLNEKKYFSYRRTSTTGRMVSLIWRY